MKCFLEHGKSFKSKFIIEKQQNLLKKLHYENNILKNEASQLKSTNSRLVTKLRSRFVPKTIRTLKFREFNIHGIHSNHTFSSKLAFLILGNTIINLETSFFQNDVSKRKNVSGLIVMFPSFSF